MPALRERSRHQRAWAETQRPAPLCQAPSQRHQPKYLPLLTATLPSLPKQAPTLLAPQKLTFTAAAEGVDTWPPATPLAGDH